MKHILIENKQTLEVQVQAINTEMRLKTQRYYKAVASYLKTQLSLSDSMIVDINAYRSYDDNLDYSIEVGGIVRLGQDYKGNPFFSTWGTAYYEEEKIQVIAHAASWFLVGFEKFNERFIKSVKYLTTSDELNAIYRVMGDLSQAVAAIEKQEAIDAQAKALANREPVMVVQPLKAIYNDDVETYDQLVQLEDFTLSVLLNAYTEEYIKGYQVVSMTAKRVTLRLFGSRGYSHEVTVNRNRAEEIVRVVKEWNEVGVAERNERQTKKVKNEA